MRIERLRNKILLSAFSISMMVALASMLAVSFVIRQQHLDQSNSLLRKASKVIEDNLESRKGDLLIASRKLATQKNLGSTIWYLSQYAQANIDRETLFNTYQKLAQDTFKLGRVANLSKIAIYDSSGKLISFALLEDGSELVGFVERFPVPVFQVATLKDDEELNRKSLRATHSIARIGFEFGGRMPQRESVHYAMVDGLLSVESYVPIMGEAFDPSTGKPEIKQLGLIAMAQPLDQAFVDHLSRLTDTKINVFIPQGFSSGDMAAYLMPDWSGVPEKSDGRPLTTSFNEITIGGRGFYQSLIPLYTDNHLVGTIAALYSKEIVQKNTLEMVETLGFIAAASLLLIFPFAWYFATSISHPLTVLSRIFRSVARSNNPGLLSDELSQLEKAKKRDDELGRLTQSFIAMNDAVNQKIRQINEINASLEHTIEERTAALVASEQESRTMLENTPDTIARYDRECRRTYANPAMGEMVDGGVAALLGKKPSEWPGGSNSEIYETKINGVFATGENTQFELKWRDKDGREICSHIRLTAERDLSGAVTSVLGVGRDITELNEYRASLKAAKAEAERANNAKSRFLAAASHDLRQPLFALDLYVSMLESKLAPGNEKMLKNMKESVGGLSEMLSKLLDLSKLEAGVVMPDVRDFPVADELALAASSHAPEAQLKGLRLHCMPSGLVARTDPVLFGRILGNLVSNAVRYTKHGGVLIGCRRRQGKTWVEVWDTGIGIPEDKTSEIFEEFKQIGNEARNTQRGSGLGLAIVAKTAALLGLQVRVRSRMGKGSMFAIELPLGSEVGRDAAEEYPSRPLRIALVEDDAIVLDALTASLETAGHEVVAAVASREILARLGGIPPDIVISDYRLAEGETGFDVITSVRGAFDNRLPAMIITGDTDPELIRSMAAKGVAVQHKPVNLHELHGFINKLTNQTSSGVSAT